MKYMDRNAIFMPSLRTVMWNLLLYVLVKKAITFRYQICLTKAVPIENEIILTLLCESLDVRQVVHKYSLSISPWWPRPGMWKYGKVLSGRFSSSLPGHGLAAWCRRQRVAEWWTLFRNLISSKVLLTLNCISRRWRGKFYDEATLTFVGVSANTVLSFARYLSTYFLTYRFT